MGVEPAHVKTRLGRQGRCAPGRALRMAPWLVALACSAQQKPDAASHGIATPLEAASSQVALATSPESSLSKTLDLEQFRPLLQQPEFTSCEQAMREDKPKVAARQFEAALARQSARRGEAASDPALSLMLGRLREAAGEPGPAIESYRLSAEQDFALAGYAHYSAGTLLASLGKAALALEHFEQVPEQLPVPLALQRGEAQKQLGHRDAAIQSFRSYLGSAQAPLGWPRAALALAQLLVARASTAGSLALEDQLEALRLVRRVATERAGSDTEREALVWEGRILAALPPEDFQRQQGLPFEEQVVRLNALVEARRYADARAAVRELRANPGYATSPDAPRCEAEVLDAKLYASQRQWSEALQVLQQALPNCEDLDLRARALFLSGRYAYNAGSYAQAARAYLQVEKEAPGHRLADDSRLKAAHAYLELGDEARFTTLLGSIAEDYPEGDMTLDGLFELAVRRMQKSDWAGALNVLERGVPLATLADTTRDHEAAGREHYFRARAWIELGDEQRGLEELADLVRRRPLSYYMQHAYSRLHQHDAELARHALEAAMQNTAEQPFAFRWRPEFETEGFQRALQLMRISELGWAQAEIERLGLGSDFEPDLLWGLALLYERAGSANLSQKVVRGRLTDWLLRWPVGDWRKAWEVAFPRPHLSIVQREAQRNEVPESLIYGVMREESVFDASAISHADAYGLMQLIPGTAKQFAKKLRLPYSERALLTPGTNIALGSRVLRDYQGYFPNNPLLAIPAYNAGPSRAKRWLEQNPNVDFDVWVELVPFRETRRYVKRVLASRGAYEMLYGSQGPAHLRLPERLHASN